MIASTRTVPWMNSPALSIASDPANGTSLPLGDGVVSMFRPLWARPHTLPTAPSRPSRVMPTCTGNRSARGTTASAITPTMAAPSTMRIGSSAT